MAAGTLPDRYDPERRLRDWWSASVVSGFDERAGKTCNRICCSTRQRCNRCSNVCTYLILHNLPRNPQPCADAAIARARAAREAPRRTACPSFAACISAFYSRLAEHDTAELVDGNLTLGEDIADIGASAPQAARGSQPHATHKAACARRGHRRRRFGNVRHNIACSG